MSAISNILKGDGTKARALRSAGFVIIGFGGQNVLRLASNLILTRLLFPEAFGVMALVQVVLIGLAMFSDLGINVSIMQHKRGEERDFLNTAWTLQILRGVVLWLVCCALAWPAAYVYNEPQLLQLLPVAGLTAVVSGFNTTKIWVANRHLQLGTQTLTMLGAQAMGILFTVVLAWFWRDVWSLVFGGIFAAFLQNILQHRMLPGPGNRFCWDREAVGSLIRFGKYIFLSSIAGFLSNQGDRAVLGGYISMGALGIYSVGYMMAMLPLQLVQAAGGKVLFPLYHKYKDLSDPENLAKVRRARRMLLAGAMAITCLMAIFGVPLIHLLYDARYDMAGPVLVLMSVAITMQLAASLYDGSYLAHGNSRAHFLINAWRAGIQTLFLFIGASQYGVLGAIVAQALGVLAVYPMQTIVTRRYRAWDPLADGLVVLSGLAAAALGIWLSQGYMPGFWQWTMAGDSPR
ncbi:oligosaccharide flippase family protein [Paenirhodobacter populi]|uniref:oligosaccharide flippase family protein n=1 Tax=Paenirhodobacter populi TaxID=2306993 RepID=UPI0013E37D8D|nr:oligosaccharide flippase family protein [Sinirhodobacter populi]